MKILLVGGSKGLGAAIHEQAWDAGYKVVARSRSTDPPLDMAWPGAKIKSTLRQAVQELGGLDALVVSSGLGAYHKILVDEEKIRQIFQVNVFGPMACYRACLPYLIRSKGKMVVITSTAARRPGSGGLSLYAAAKGALNSWVISEGRRAAKEEVALCAVAPGFFWSEMTDAMNPKLMDATTRAIPFGRWGEAEEIARLTVDLLGQSNWCLAGQIYECSGGA